MADAGQERELRLALVMTGGVSLAVWMGGVAAELYRASKSEGLYGRLLAVTATTLKIDVIAGSSAGGLNGALLGTMLARDADPRDFDDVRDLWFEAGSFHNLLRSPWAPNAPSLLKGDDYFAEQLLKLLQDVRRQNPRVADDRPTVVLTCSLLTPDQRTYQDDFGTLIDQPIHRGLFTFTGDELATGDVAKLALAARTSASFPGAFEPSFVPIGEDLDGRPDMADVADFRRSHWAVDGGVLVNKPVGPVLNLIAKRSSDGEVRRVLAYVNPDPGGGGAPAVDRWGEPPALGSVVLDSLVTLPRAESIAADLDEIRQHNRRITGQSRLRVTLLSEFSSSSSSTQVRLVALARQVYPMWRRKRTAWSIDRRMTAHYDRARLDPTSPVAGSHFTHAELRDAMIEVRHRRDWVPKAFPDELPDPTSWRFGFHPLEYFCSVALDLIRRAYALLPATPSEPAADSDSDSDSEGADGPDPNGVRGARALLGEYRREVHVQRQWIRALRVCDADFWARRLTEVARQRERCALAEADLLHDEWLHPSTWPAPWNPEGAPGALPRSPEEEERRWAWHALHRLVDGAEVVEPPPGPDEAPSARDGERPGLDGDVAKKVRVAEQRIAEALVDVLGRLHGPTLVAVASYARRPTEAGAEPATTTPASSPKAVLPDTTGTEGKADESPCPTVPVTQPDKDVQAIVDGLALGADKAVVLERLLALYVVHMTTEDAFADNEVRIELIQVSANTPTPLDGRSTAADKLAGLQLGHFGAFLKESWRANDWMWGTLDGGANLVTLLLEPARLRQVFAGTLDGVTTLRRVVCPTADDEVPSDEDAWLLAHVWNAECEKKVAEELSFLGRLDVPLPARLPVTAGVLTHALHLQLARRELPVVSGAVERTTKAGGGECRPASKFVSQVHVASEQASPLLLESVGPLMRSCAVGSEPATDELGSDAGAALAATALAVVTGVASGSKSGLGPLRHAAKPVRTASLAVHVLARSAGSRSRTGFALTTLLLAIGGGTVAARLLGGEVPNGVLVVALALLAAWVVFTGFTVGAPVVGAVVALAVGIVALAFIEPHRVCPVFAEEGCGRPPPEWKDNVGDLVPLALLVVAALVVGREVCRWAMRRWLGPQDTRPPAPRPSERRPPDSGQQAAAKVDPVQLDAERRDQEQRDRERRRLVVRGRVVAGCVVLAGCYAFVLHAFVFERPEGSKWIGFVGWLSRNQALVTLVLLPAVLIGLGYFRFVWIELHSRWARRRTYVVADPSPGSGAAGRGAPVEQGVEGEGDRPAPDLGAGEPQEAGGVGRAVPVVGR